MRIVTPKEMKELEAISREEYQFDDKLIIENVGIMGAERIVQKLGEDITNCEVIFFIGNGNNGADGLSIARHMMKFGIQPRAFMLFDEKQSSIEMTYQTKKAKAFGVKIHVATDVAEIESYFSQVAAPKVIIDAIFGTGVRFPLPQHLYDTINLINNYSSYTVSLDIPTGIEGEFGSCHGNAVKADMTLAVGLPKLGYYQGEGAKLIGEIEHLEIGFPTQLTNEGGDKFLLTKESLSLIESDESRNKFGDKKLFGHTLVIGGSHGLTGAPVMAATAALKVGAGLVTACTWEPQYHEMMFRLIPEIMTGYIPNDQAKWGRVLQDINKYDSIVVGPGLARSTRSRKLVLEILNNFSGPIVLDADAINVLSMKEDSGVFAMRNAPTVLTPHLGEFARFSGLSIEEVSKKPFHHLREVIERINCSVILKGPCTYLGLAHGETYFNFSPNDGMATGGVGDVLAGILGGLLSQEANLKKRDSLYNIYENMKHTILQAVLVHTEAGKFAVQKHGVRTMTATSLIEFFPEAFKSIDGQEHE